MGHRTLAHTVQVRVSSELEDAGTGKGKRGMPKNISRSYKKNHALQDQW